MDNPQRRPRIRDPKYLVWLRQQPCCICGDKSEACHIRSASIAYAKRETGFGEKPDDKWCLPMCRSDHSKQHSMNELEFWRRLGMDPFSLARRYYARAALVGHTSPKTAKPKRKSTIPSRPFPKTSRKLGQ